MRLAVITWDAGKLHKIVFFDERSIARRYVQQMEANGRCPTVYRGNDIREVREYENGMLYVSIDIGAKDITL
jgi:hypothetical protein